MRSSPSSTVSKAPRTTPSTFSSTSLSTNLVIPSFFLFFFSLSLLSYYCSCSASYTLSVHKWYAAKTVKSSIIDKDPVHRVVSLLLEAEAAAEDGPDIDGVTGGSSASSIRVIDAFLVPKFRYDPIKKIFYEFVTRHSFTNFVAHNSFRIKKWKEKKETW